MFIDVAILGATGLVGQKVIALLINHPFFRIKELVASENRQGKFFKEECSWIEPLSSLPEEIGNIKLTNFYNLQSQFVISCLPANIAQDIEPVLAKEGKIIFSNASPFRLNDNIPLIVPEINCREFNLIDLQLTKGKIIKNPNCSVIGITLALAPLLELSAIELLNVVTLQSISGAGYLGLSSLDILGNTIPYIKNEEEKIICETKRLLNKRNEFHIGSILVQVHRVPVLFGHTISLQICFKNKVTFSEVIEQYKSWNKTYKNLFVFHNEKGRPQANKDLNHRDMRVHIGHCKLGETEFQLSLVILINNLVRGAAGAIIANMENFIEFQKEMQLCQKI